MPALRQFEQLGVRHCPGDVIDLGHRAVGIVFALNGQQGRRKGGQFGSNVECAKGLAQPNLVPLPKGTVHIGMKRRQPLAQWPVFKCLTCRRDGLNGQVFHHHMRGHDHATSHIKTAGMQQRDGAAVRMPQQDRPLDAQGVQQGGQDVQRFAVHVVGKPSTPALSIDLARGAAHIGHGVRFAVALPRIEPPRTAQLCTEFRRPIAPHAHAAQALMQEHQVGTVLGLRVGQVQNFQLLPEQADFCG